MFELVSDVCEWQFLTLMNIPSVFPDSPPPQLGGDEDEPSSG